MSDYKTKKKKFTGMMTLYGRKPVLEVPSDQDINVYRLHLATSNADSPVIREIETLAKGIGIETAYHDRQSLSRISKNGRQDQGVAIDIEPAGYLDIESLEDETSELIGLDGITNSQNLGMIIRSVAASPMDGLVLPRKGCARIDSLVHKASAGTLFKSTIFHSPTLEHAISKLKTLDFEIIGLSADSSVSITDLPPEPERRCIFLLGNESTGLRSNIAEMCHSHAAIPMAGDVESLNVSTAAALVAFRGLFG